MKKTALCGVLLVVGFIVFLELRVGQRDIGDEALVVGTLTAINHAQTVYAFAAGHGNYAVTLEALSEPCPDTAEPFLSSELARDPLLRHNYQISMSASMNAQSGPLDCHGRPTQSGYYLTAQPVHPMADGLRHRAFATDAKGEIWEGTRGIAPTQPFAVSRSVKHLQ
jgi:hypothetical protein